MSSVDDVVARLSARLEYSIGSKDRSQIVTPAETIVKKDDIRAILAALEASRTDDSGVVEQMRDWLQAIRDEAWKVRDTDAGMRVCELTKGALDALLSQSQQGVKA